MNDLVEYTTLYEVDVEEADASMIVDEWLERIDIPRSMITEEHIETLVLLIAKALQEAKSAE